MPLVTNETSINGVPVPQHGHLWDRLNKQMQVIANRLAQWMHLTLTRWVHAHIHSHTHTGVRGVRRRPLVHIHARARARAHAHAYVRIGRYIWICGYWEMGVKDSREEGPSQRLAEAVPSPLILSRGAGLLSR